LTFTAFSWRAYLVTDGNIAFLAFVVGGMVVFGLALAWVNHITSR
jgi:hypothetical protein